MESTFIELFITFLSVTFIIMKNCAATLKWNNNFANVSATTFLPYPRVRDISPRPRGCKNYPELPCELTEKLTETAVRA